MRNILNKNDVKRGQFFPQYIADTPKLARIMGEIWGVFCEYNLLFI